MNRSQRPRWFWLAVAAATLVTIFYVAWMLFGFGGPRMTRWFDDVAQGVTPVLAAIACGLTAYRAKERQACWVLLGASALAWAAGEGVWCYYDIGLGVRVPFPSLADAGFLSAVPLAVAGLLLFPSSPQRLASRARGLIDGLLIAGGLLYLSWATVFGTLYETHQDGLLAKLLSLAYPAGDVVLASLVLILITRSRQQGTRTPLLLVMAAIFGFALSDSSFAYLTQVHNYIGTIANLLDTGWFAGYLVLALGALSAMSSPVVAARSEDRVTRASILVPYAPVALAAGLTLVRFLNHQPFGLFLSVEGFALVIVLSVRQILTLFDNMSLNHRLETKVEMGTAELQTREARFAAMVQNASDVVTIVDPEGVIMFQTPSVRRVLGWESESTVGTNLLSAMCEGDRQKWDSVVTRSVTLRSDVVAEWRVRHADGSWRYLQTVVSDLTREPSVGGFVLNSRDITDQKALEEQLRHQAFHDVLTGLANRALFLEQLDQATRRRGRVGGGLALLFIDLDNFKAVNDLHGHVRGDELLKQAAERLRATVRHADALARLGGDEFALLFEGVALDTYPRSAAERIIGAFAEPFRVGSSEVLVTASIGIALDESGTETAEELLRNADLAMYSAKAKPEGGFEVFTSGMHSKILSRMQVEADLQRALNEDELQVYYQPVIDNSSESIGGVEALVRWGHPERGLVMPGDFIPVAESSGMIVQIGEWVLRHACQEFAALTRQLEGGEQLGLSVNLAARQLRDPALFDTVCSAAADAGLDFRRLTLEITESTIMEDVEAAVRVLTQLRTIGVKVAIDDFGTGYSSLSLLSEIPVDTLKIDRAFVTELVTRPEPARLVRAILLLASDFGFKTVAEGVEERDQYQLLQELGCQASQGFYFGRPQPAGRLFELLRQGAPASWSQRGPEPDPADRYRSASLDGSKSSA